MKDTTTILTQLSKQRAHRVVQIGSRDSPAVEHCDTVFLSTGRPPNDRLWTRCRSQKRGLSYCVEPGISSNFLEEGEIVWVGA